MVFDLDLDPHELWELDVEVHPGLDGEGDHERVERLANARRWATSSRRGRSACQGCAAAGRASGERFDRSIDDLAALRMRTGES